MRALSFFTNYPPEEGCRMDHPKHYDNSIQHSMERSAVVQTKIGMIMKFYSEAKKSGLKTRIVKFSIWQKNTKEFTTK